MAGLDSGPCIALWGSPITPGAAKYEPAVWKMATDKEMKVVLVLAIVLLAAATAFAYGRTDVAAGVTGVVAQTTHMVVSEPATILISGGLLLVLASAVRRLPI
jgi:phosphate/sulfate permease